MDETNDQPEVRWLTVAQVADQLQVAEETVRRWIRSGDLPVLELGGVKTGFRIKPADLDAFIDARYGRRKNAA